MDFAIESGLTDALQQIVKIKPVFIPNLNSKLMTSLLTQETYFNQNIANFVILHFKTTEIYYVFMKCEPNHPFHFEFSNFILTIFNDEKYPTINLSHFSILKAFQAIYNTNAGEKQILECFSTKGIEILIITSIVKMIMKH